MSQSEFLIGAIDQGTSSSRFLLFDERCQLMAKHQVEVAQLLPEEGWMEQDPRELIDSVQTCLNEVGEKCSPEDIRKIRGVGITNQRETTILWDKRTGECLHNAIVWCDSRTADIAKRLIAQTPGKSQDHFRPLCGLPIHSYFSALKVKWLMEHSRNVQRAIEENRCLFGTVDTWVIWRLTGGPNGGVHVTDVTNASRTMLMNINTLQWDKELCSFFDIPMDILPEIHSSAEEYGKIAEGPLKGIPICGCLGDQQSALVGQQCFSPGDAKNTYGTGCFLLENTGEQPVRSQHGMLTTVAYKLGRDQPLIYALEGSVSIGGQSVRWLRDNLGFFKHAKEIEDYAKSVDNTSDVYFVPAFSGLYAPYWEPDARGLVVGLTNFTNKAHLCRATLEAVCFQSKEILDAMIQDSELPRRELRVDGGMTVNNTLLQLQADLLGIPVVRPDFKEMSALGATIAAGLAAGVWRDTTQLPTYKTLVFLPSINSDDRDGRYAKWKEAVHRSMHWVGGSVKKDSGQKKASFMFALGCTLGVLGAVLTFTVLRRR